MLTRFSRYQTKYSLLKTTANANSYKSIAASYRFLQTSYKFKHATPLPIFHYPFMTTQLISNPRFKTSSTKIYGPRVHKRKHKFLRRFLLFSLLFGLWMNYVDADFITYFYNEYQKSKSSFLSRCHRKDFHGKTIWVVGASSGIGEYLSYQLTTSNVSRLILSGRRVSELERVKRECEKINPHCEVITKQLDVLDFVNNTDEYSKTFLQELYTTELDNRDIDILVLNSGVIPKGWAIDTPMSTMQETLEVNTLGLISVTQAMINHWFEIGAVKRYAKTTKNHQIVVTSSVTAKNGCPGYATYSMTKAGLNAFMEAMRIEHYKHNINFNIVCIGATFPSAGTYDRTRDEVDDKYWAALELERVGELYSSAILLNHGQSWIATQPYLFYVYVAQYLPILAPWGTSVFGQRYLRDLPVKPDCN